MVINSVMENPLFEKYFANDILDKKNAPCTEGKIWLCFTLGKMLH